MSLPPLNTSPSKVSMYAATDEGGTGGTITGAPPARSTARR